MVKKRLMYVGPHDVYPAIDINFSILTRECKKKKSLSTMFSLQTCFVINVLNYKTVIALKLA